ncbi:AAA family ATPase [Desulfococcaceae bacterium HSG7]|nr:AAA family ATPase [Desulfococcaceae bacterium HSG7]
MITIPGYRNLTKIYESASSLVFRAVKEEDNQPIILKILKEDYPSSDELTRYRQEYDITRSLTDLSGVVNVCSLEKHRNTLMMCLEDFGGESLRIWLDQKRIFTLDELLTFAIRITEILGQIHKRNIIHKDICPSNIILNPASGVLRIIDFGISTQLSKQYRTLKNPDMLEGTLAYMSPEQTGRMNRALDYRTDFYSLGVTFYELFTGKLPFEAKDAMESVHCHIAKLPVPPCELQNRVFSKNPVSVQEMISNIIMKLLEKTAEARYLSAWGLKADLEECLKQWQTTGQIEPFSPARFDLSEQFQIPQKLYGRDSEIETLLSTFERVAGGKTEMMLVAGYSGIGKSALVKEIYKSLAEKRGYFITGKFDQLDRNIPYSAVVMAFQELVRQLLSESEKQLAVWKEKLLTALGNNGQVIIDILPAIESLIGKQPAVPQLGLTESQNRFELLFQNFMHVFCQPEHPLVVFLDDLQWIDSATLKLLELVMNDIDNTSFFFIGAYRDNEVDPTHPLLVTLDKLREERVTMNRITLHPLAFEHIQQLIAESVHHTPEAVSALTDSVMRKTGGNPFFVNLFLHTLYEENALHFVPPTYKQKACWQWDIDHIERLDITDNVVELMIGKLKKLPESAQQVLRLAACVGNQFDLNTLSVIYEKSTVATFEDVMPVLTEGFILPLSEPEMSGSDIHTSQWIIHHFQFLHDRVQQAAYALIDNEQKRAVHLLIGRLLLKNTPADALEGKVFDIAGHFNHSLELLDNLAERRKVAQLNLMAGHNAKMATAYRAAVSYLTAGRECLPEKSWENEYDLTLNLFTEAAEAAYLSGDFKQMEHLAQVVLHHARTLSDEAKVCEIQIQSYIAQNLQQKAIETALIFLKRLGISFPEEPTQEDIGLALQTMHVSLSGKSIRNLIDLHKMTNTHNILAMRIMGAVVPTAYAVAPELMILLVVKQVALSLAYGNIAESGFSYVCYGFILCGVVGDIEAGYEFSLLAADLFKQMDEKKFKIRIIFVFNGLIRVWKGHVREALQPLLGNYQLGLEIGDLEYAALSTHAFSYFSYFIGKPLAALEREIALYSHAIAQLKQEVTLNWINLFWQVVLNLLGRSNHPCRLIGEVYDENIQSELDRQANDRTAVYNFHINKSILHYLFQEYAPAIANAEIAEQHLDGVTGTLEMAMFYFYDSLARLAVYPGLPQQEQDAVLTKVAANQEKMKHWAFHAPMNFQHKYDLAEAEKARVTGQNWQAVEFYEKAIAGAKEHEYLNEEALAYELAGQFYLNKGNPKIAQVYMRDAHYAYQQWGATAKVHNLEARYPQFLAPKTARVIPADAATSTTRMTSTSTNDPEQLDLNSIMKAAQTLSGEIVLSRLLENMMHIVIENAGAEKGFLLLPEQDNWYIQAQGHADSSETVVLQSLPFEESGLVSADIIYYVARTQENVILHDATQKGDFIRDIYIVKHRPKSVLCMPLVNQGRLTGILYLENNLTTGAFTPRRLEILNLISSQIAVSIENSLLYNRLEEKVTERTHELYERTSELELEIVVRKKAEKAAEKANLAKSMFLANMSHELRTPLNGILGFAQILQREPSVTAEQRHGLEVIEQSGDHLSVLIDDVLDLAKVESGKIELYKTDFNLSSLLSGVCEIINIRAENKGVDFYLESANDLPRSVHGDKRRLRQILLNLSGNAVKFTDQGSVALKVSLNKGEHLAVGRVSDSVTRHQQQNEDSRKELPLRVISFKIEDTGIGIAPENLERIFEPFEQIRKRGRQTKGTGLGLAISKNLIEQMGGRLSVSSQMNVGTRFQFELTLPIVDNNISTIARRQIIGVQGEPPKIMIADDNSVNRAVLSKLLARLGFNIKLAEDGREGLRKSLKWRPDVIITDLTMPETDGFQLIRQLRRSPVLKEKIIIATSASEYEADKSIAAGSDTFLPKPIRIETLLEQLQRLLNLTWIYGDKVKETAEKNHADKMIFPPAAELKQLYELSLMGDIDELEKQAAILAEADVKLKPFVTQMLAFLEKYLVNKFSEWLEGEMMND